MGRALWMVSISFGPQLAVDEWSREQDLVAYKIARRTLEGVGRHETDIVGRGIHTLTIRRERAPHERRQVVEPYLVDGSFCTS